MYYFNKIHGYFLAAFVVLYLTTLSANDKVLIFTYSYNRADFIEIQHRTFEKFLKDDYEFVVFNDAKDPVCFNEIHQTCSRLGIPCLDMPQHLHLNQAPSHRNAAIVNYSLKKLGFAYDGIVVLLDSDMFLVKDFSVREYLGENPLSGLYQMRSKGDYIIDYLWVGIVFLDMSQLPNKEILDFSPGTIQGTGVDTGGYTHHYLSQHRDLPIKFMNMQYTQHAFNLLLQCGCGGCTTNLYPCWLGIQRLKNYGNFDDNQIRFIHATGGDNSEFYIDSHFFHYRCGSNWDNQSNAYHMNKTKCFNEYINTILED